MLDIDALDADDVQRQLQQRALVGITVDAPGGMFKPKAPKFALLLFVHELHALLVAGLSVIEAIEVLIDKETSNGSRAVLVRLTGHLREGRPLSDALLQQPSVFPELFLGIVQAAEGTSDLPRSLARYMSYESRINAIKQKLVSAAIYPSILLTVGSGVALFLLGYVVPRFSTVYRSGGRELPWASRLLLEWGEFAGKHGVELLAVVSAVLVMGAWAVRRRLRQGNLVQFLAMLPGMRLRLQILELSRLYMTLGMLLEGGLPLTRALKLGRTVLSADHRPSMDEVVRQIGQGESMTSALEAAGLVTPVSLRLLQVGERSGQLGPMLNRTADFYEGDIARWIERFTKAFEPILMAGIGIVIGLVVILLYLPIFELAGSL